MLTNISHGQFRRERERERFKFEENTFYRLNLTKISQKMTSDETVNNLVLTTYFSVACLVLAMVHT